MNIYINGTPLDILNADDSLSITYNAFLFNSDNSSVAPFSTTITMPNNKKNINILDISGFLDRTDSLNEIISATLELGETVIDGTLDIEEITEDEITATFYATTPSNIMTQPIRELLCDFTSDYLGGSYGWKRTSLPDWGAVNTGPFKEYYTYDNSVYPLEFMSDIYRLGNTGAKQKYSLLNVKSHLNPSVSVLDLIANITAKTGVNIDTSNVYNRLNNLRLVGNDQTVNPFCQKQFVFACSTKEQLENNKPAYLFGGQNIVNDLQVDPATVYTNLYMTDGAVDGDITPETVDDDYVDVLDDGAPYDYLVGDNPVTYLNTRGQWQSAVDGGVTKITFEKNCTVDIQIGYYSPGDSAKIKFYCKKAGDVQATNVTRQMVIHNSDMQPRDYVLLQNNVPSSINFEQNTGAINNLSYCYTRSYIIHYRFEKGDEFEIHFDTSDYSTESWKDVAGYSAVFEFTFSDYEVDQKNDYSKEITYIPFVPAFTFIYKQGVRPYRLFYKPYKNSDPYTVDPYYSYYNPVVMLGDLTVGELVDFIAHYCGYKTIVSQDSISFDVLEQKVLSSGVVTSWSPFTSKLGQTNIITYNDEDNDAFETDNATVVPATNPNLEASKTLYKSKIKKSGNFKSLFKSLYSPDLAQIPFYKISMPLTRKVQNNQKVPLYSYCPYTVSEGGQTATIYLTFYSNQQPEIENGTKGVYAFYFNTTNGGTRPPEKLKTLSNLVEINKAAEVTIKTFDNTKDVDIVVLDGRQYYVTSSEQYADNTVQNVVKAVLLNIEHPLFNYAGYDIIITNYRPSYLYNELYNYEVDIVSYICKEGDITVERPVRLFGLKISTSPQMTNPLIISSISPTIKTQLPTGRYYIQAWAASGELDSAAGYGETAVFTADILLQEPTVTINSITQYLNVININYTVNGDEITSVEVLLDGEQVQAEESAGTYQLSFSNLAEGEHAFEVNAGNDAGDATEYRTFTVEPY